MARLTGLFTQVPPAVEASEPPPVRKPVSGVAAQFAAQVAAVADTTNKDKVRYLRRSNMVLNLLRYHHPP